MLIHSSGVMQDFLQLNAVGASACSEVFASIPYAMLGVASEDFYQNLQESNIPVLTYLRVDWSVPFDTRILSKYARTNMIFKGVENFLHAKVIWWRGWGVYVGSCNLTDRACFENFEVGVFISHAEISGDLEMNLTIFFENLGESSFAIDVNLISFLDSQNDNLSDFRVLRNNLDLDFRKNLRNHLLPSVVLD